jgi:alanyl aminopeptidase
MPYHVRILLVLLALGCVLAPVVNAQAVGSPPTISLTTPPSLRLPTFARPTSYRVRLALDPAKETFDGAMDIELELSTATPILWLNGKELQIHSARLSLQGVETPVSVVAGGDEFIGFRFERPVGPGQGVLHIDYSGKVDATSTSGMFHQQEGGKWYLFSDFEPTDARRVFPCFDEPSYKVPWQLTMDVPAGFTAVTNTPQASSEPLADGLQRVVFRPTKPLPSYLVALAVGPFDVVDAGTAGRNHVPLRILAPHGKADQADYAKELMPEALNRLESYFGIAFPYAKLDAVAIPQTVSFGAMENAGMITYVEGSILAPPNERTAEFKHRAGRYIVHETSHQWFGDLVTMAWWNDLWLNESFASWMEDRILAPWKPEWHRDVVQVEVRDSALGSDLLPSARKIRQPIESLDDITNAFDNVTYRKGASIIQMFEAWMGPETFRRGVRRYLQAHRFGNATAEDFLAALQAEGPPGTAAAFKTFLEQVGAPLLKVDLHCAAGAAPKLALEQSRLRPLGVPAMGQETWRLPVCVRYGAGDDEQRACTLLTERTGEIAVGATGACPDWVEANDHSLGYYRTLYAPRSRSRLLHSGLDHLSVAERVGFLGDESALSVTGQRTMGEVLDLVPTFARSDAWQLVSRSAEIVERVGENLVPENMRPNYARFIRDVFGERARRLGFAAAAGDSDDTRQLRESIVALVARQGEDPELIGEAKRLAGAWLEDHSAVDAGMIGTVLTVAARNGDEALFDRFVKALAGESERRDRMRLYAALGAFREPELQARALDMLLAPDADLREAGTIFSSSMSDGSTRQQAWDFFTKNFDALWTRMPRGYAPYLPYYGARFCDDAHRQAVRAFFTPRLDELRGAKRTLAQVLEIIQTCAGLRQVQQPSVVAFLQGY